MEGLAESKLLQGLRQLCGYSDFARETLVKYLYFKDFTSPDLDTLKTSLSEFLLKPDHTVVVAQCFPHTVLELLLIGEENGEKSELTLEDKSYHHQCMCVALGKLVNIHPDAVRFSLQYFENNPPPFHDVTTASLSPSSRKKLKLSPTKIADYLVSDLEIVKSCYSFLHVSSDYFRQHWNWSDFIELYVGHEDEFICWLACQCLSVVVGMTDAQIQDFIRGYLSPEAIRACIVRFDSFQTEYSFTEIETSPGLRTTFGENTCEASFYVASIAGIQLPVVNPEAQERGGCLVHVPSTVANLKSLALALASGRAICLQGSVGCGKTSLVEHLTLLTGRTCASEFMKVQLGDQTDSKMLLGTYRCTDIPGEFVWQPGVLTQAVIGGHWILLEDIDSAAADVMSVLTSLIETGTLCVPGYRDTVKVSPGFQLFVTRRLMPNSSSYQQLNSANFLQKHWVQIHVEPLLRSELIEVVQTMFPLLATISARIVDVFLLFSAENHKSALRMVPEINKENMDMRSSELLMSRVHQRLISTRDLIKWCTRSVEGFDVSSQDSALKVFQDAIDVFCCSFTYPESRLKLATKIGSCLGIIKSRAEFFCMAYKPNIKVSSLSFMAGRVILPRQSETITQLESFSTTSSFAFTRPTACLLERLACCVAQIEPVLLVGETGTGKTSAVQYLANKTGHQLIVINMNQQSDSADLLGGYKPVDLKYVVGPVRDEFEMLFRCYFSVPKNIRFLHHIGTCYNSRRWNTLLKLMKHSLSAAMKRLLESDDEERRFAWQQLGAKLLKLETQLKTQSALAFTFIEGSLVRALRGGYWVLLDEINLASAETLECLSGLLEGSAGSLSLLERGDEEPIQRHPDFRLFACMNPATDVGKKELPAGLRNRFTEFFVDELIEKSDLLLLVGTYLQDLSLPIVKLDNIVKFYLGIRKEATMRLTDGTGHKPCYSLRTLCRALSVAAQNKCGTVLRSLYEALCLSFLTQLDYSSHPIVEKMVARAVMGAGDVNSILNQPIPQPVSESEEYVCFEGYWISRGSLEPEVDEKYIITQSVRRNLRDLVRIVSIGHHPVLLQGETSVGKTSLITYLAKASGNYCVRINNHEHTDLQEYIGSYSADENGRLIFQEGVLVEAMRRGHWIILDELNLAPTDVLEALNRVLDDNRELFISETQEVVKAHPHFMLFATQNPPGLYGGRKILSRAFRNRFVELHFDEIPANELEMILHKRCELPISYCGKMIAVMTDLQVRRKGSAAFAGKQGFITLRDLFRWGERYRLAGEQQDKFYDWSQHIADEGYLVLAGRVRKPEECLVIQEVIKKHINKTVEPEKLFTLNEETSSVTRTILEQILTNTPPGFGHIVWTFNMRRLAVLVGKAFQFKEPVLLVGETGCGKTTVCQLLAAMYEQTLYTVNCHMHTESADFLGGLRPVRDHSSDAESVKLFEWVDGPLIEAMQNGDLFLADEISLADDSVLERLNSLLEPERKLLLAEKGGEEIETDILSCVIVAHENFHIIGTMNPGGDYGKKELSPALRNRFTEIWCESCRERSDLIAIVEHNLNVGLFLGNQQDGTSGVGSLLLDFIEWFVTTDIGKRFTVSVRDILSWVNFINTCTEDPDFKSEDVKKLDLPSAYIHGACLTFLDSLGSGVTSIDSVKNLKILCKDALKYLMEQIELDIDDIDSVKRVVTTETHFGIHPFYIKRGPLPITTDVFTFSAPTTGLNASRVLRGLQLNKPILLEGSPGVGKTSLVAALAKASGYHLTRINLSDQTDVSDLFGADLPIEGGEGGQFAWRDGPFLQALKAGHWILLDELNLASQSVLEGLNACLDHRGEVFIPELGKTFHIQNQSTRLFGAQNPLRQGGARRGLPRSFLNRFTQVYIDSLTEADLEFIIRSLFPILPDDLIYSMVTFNSRLARETGELRLWGQKGAPWELNLRDLCRWCEAVMDDYKNQMIIEQEGKSGMIFKPGKFVDLIYIDRMRTKGDKEKVMEIYIEEFGSQYPLLCDFPRIHLTPNTVLIDDIALSRDGCKIQRKCKYGIGSESEVVQSFSQQQSDLMLLRRQFPALRSLSRCVNMNWLAILVGPPGSGKTSVVYLMSQLIGQELRVLSVNSAMDTMEILGGFEQADYNRHLDEIAARIERLLLDAVRRRLLTTIDSSLGSPRPDVTSILRQWEVFTRLANQDKHLQHTLASETQLFKYRMTALLDIINILFPEFEGRQAFESELKSLKGQLLKLANNVMKEGNLNAGGKFEWLDSVLVKCVQDGTWLLIDNVNLCSPAVLDRLNALLEPGGVLTIGERGVGPDGQLVTITPHPDFRLFMTMDPHNGEISRAMRNRGVEIYMLGPNEEEYNILDLRSLMYSIGLKIHSHQDTLLTIHQVMRQKSQDMDGPGIAQLLHAAFLIGQQISLGQPLYEAFLSSCYDVYVKPYIRRVVETIGFLTLRQSLYDVLIETLRDSSLMKKHLKDRLLDSATLTVPKIKENSVFANVKQQGSLLKAFLEAVTINESGECNETGDTVKTDRIPNTKVLNQLLGFEDKYPSEVKIVDVIPNCLLIFYHLATPNDIELRHEWLTEVITKCKEKTTNIRVLNILNKSLKVSETLRDVILQSSSPALNEHKNLIKHICNIDDLPWDIRWLPSVAMQCRHTDQLKCSMCIAANKLSLLLYLKARKIHSNTLTEERDVGQRNSLTVAEYSTALMHGTLSDDITSDPVVTRFSQLIHMFDECLEAALKCENTSLDTAQCNSLQDALDWRFRFAQLGSLQLMCNKENESDRRATAMLIDGTVSNLRVHYNWLSKWTFPKLLFLLEQDSTLKNSAMVKQFECIIKEIESSVAVSLSVLIPVGKKMKLTMGYPLPHADLQQVQLLDLVQRVSDTMSLWQFGSLTQFNKNKALVNFLQTKMGLKSRLDIAFAFRQLLQDANHEQVVDVIRDVEQSYQNAISPEIHTDEEEGISALKVPHSSSNVELWPVQDLMCLLLSGALKKSLLWNILVMNIAKQQNANPDIPAALRIARPSLEDIATNLCSLMLPLPSIPPQYTAMVEILINSSDLTVLSSDVFRKVIPSLMTMMLQHSELSPGVNHLKEWISWSKKTAHTEGSENGTKMDWLETGIIKEESLPLHCPVMTNLVTSFVMQNGQNSDVGATLCSQKTLNLQLSVLKEVLWRNMVALSSPTLNYMLNDAYSAQTYFQIFIQSLQTVVDNFTIALPKESLDVQVEAISQALTVFSFNRGRLCEETTQERKMFADILMKLTETVTRLKKILTTFTRDRTRFCENATKDKQILVATGEMWTFMGLLQVMMYGNLGLIDPVAKKKLKLQYISEEAEETENMLYAQDLQSSVCYRSLNEFDDYNVHPYIIVLRGKLEHLVTRHKEFKKCVAARPEPSLFDALAKEALHYSRSLSSPEAILNMHKNIVNMIKKLSEQAHDEQEKITLLNRAEEILNEEKTWEESQQMFCDRFDKKYSKWYPDMVVPLISAATQLRYGMQKLATLLRKQVIQAKVTHNEGSVDKLLHNLVCFPSLGSNQESVISLVNTCTSDDTFSLVSKALESDCDWEQLRKLVKSGLEELKNLVMVKGDLQYDVWTSIEQLLGQIVQAWRQQEDERKQQEKEKESLFVTKETTQCKTLSEEEQMATELEELFPSSSSNDFGDLQHHATLEQVPTRENSQRESVIGLVTPDVMDYVCQLHSHILQSYTNSAWLLPTPGSSKYSHLRPDFIRPLLERYKTFGMLLGKLSRTLNSSLDMKLYPSLSMLVSVTLNVIDRGRTKFSDSGDLALPASPVRHLKLSSALPTETKTFDFYKDSYVKEVKQCLPVLLSLDERVKELLAEWPEHPTLQQMLTIIKRILNFPLTSPVARFMAGLEILLDKMHEWEENAHSGVSLLAHWNAVTNQIGSWRKLELQCWKHCLDSVADKIKRDASKWWFYIYSLVESCMNSGNTESNETQSSEELIKTLQKFIEQSTLGEFEARLNILFSFHCHVVHFPQTSQRDELMNILWNIYNYYCQFSEAVASKIKELRSPIEKKLKDCVKIFRWNDISHWAIKEAIKKVHRILHKHIKEFQEVLSQPVKEALTNPSSESAEINVGAWDRPQRHQPRLYQSLLEPMNFVSNLRLKKITTEEEKEGTLLSRSGTLHARARKLCRQTIMNTPYARYIQSVDGLVTEVIETSSRLKNLSVPEDISKAKKKSQIKNFRQQKQKALADLFRTLQQMGLSYRTGLTYWNVGETSLIEFTLPPLDLRASFQHFKNRRIYGPLLSLWDGSETYFLRAIARLALLNASLQNAAKDLGPPSIDRCRGFATHLMVLSREQKQSLIESSQLLCSLRCQVMQLIALEDTDVLLPKQSILQNWISRLKDLLVTAIICLEQFRIFLYCCPSDDEQNITSNCDVPVVELPGLKCPSIVQAIKGDDVWSSALEKVKSLIISLSKLKSSIEKCELVPSSLYAARTEAENTPESDVFVARPLCELMIDGYKQIERYVKEIKSLKVAFESKPEQCFVRVELVSEIPEESNEENNVNPMTQSLTWLQSTMEKEIKEFNSFMKENNIAACVKSVTTASSEENVEGPIVSKFRIDTETFLKNILLIVQEIYKKYTQNSDVSVVNGEEMDETENDDKQNKENIVNDEEKGRTYNEKQNKENVDDDEEEETIIEDGHLKEKVIGSLTTTLSILQMKKINNELNELLQRLMNILDLENGIKEGNICKRLLLRCLPCLDQLVLLYQFFVTQQVASYRVSCKLLSVLLAIFIELAQKGFCLPQVVTSDEEGSQFESKAGGMGLGEGEGEKDISEQIESEEQLEEARPKAEEKTEEDKECKEEEKGIEMSEDFEGKVQDLEKKEDEENDSDKDDNEEEEPDNEMGETETGADKLDQQIWGSDSEEEEEEEEGEEEKEEERGTGEKTGTPELGAKEDKEKPDEDERESEDNEKHEPKQKEINEMEDGDENEDQIDPYHGKQEPHPEPEPLDLPDDLQLDDGNEKKEEEEENPFDIDKMKEQKAPEQEDKEDELSEDKKETDNPSDEEMEVEEEKDENERKQEQEETENGDDKGVEEDETGGGSKDEKKSGEEPKLEPDKEDEEKAEPSDDKSSHTPAEAAEMDEAFGSKDQVIPDKDNEETQQPTEDSMAEGKDDKQGVGQAQVEETDSGHQGQMTDLKENVQTAHHQQELKQEKRHHFQESDCNRSLGEVNEPLKKKLKTMNLTTEEEVQQDDKDEEDGAKLQEEAEMYQHIKEAKKSIDVQTLAAATEEQAEQQPVPNLENEEGEEVKDDDIMEIQSEPEENEAPKLDAEKVPNDKRSNEKEEKMSGEKVEGGDIEMGVEVEVEGNKVDTLIAARGSETTFHTVFTEVETTALHQDLLSLQDHQTLRSQLENQLATWSQPPPDEEAEKTWEMFSAMTAGLARDLSEQLRLVLEPTQASRLRGDYRTGRRINMRKVIPYIASQFRKDKIWLRRTKPFKREYQIVLAIDDSSSMADNHSKELAFESLSLVSRALTLLEAGELSVISFGELPRVLHKLGDPFTEQSGARLLQQFSFEQKNTRVGQLVDFATTMFILNRTKASSTADRAQLLVIVSDGRIISEGTDKVKQAVRRAKHNGIFMVFLIIDNPESKDSILDIQQPVFVDNKCVGFASYLDNFPFPFYLILRDINALPTVLSDALRQWFELVTNMDK